MKKLNLLPHSWDVSDITDIYEKNEVKANFASMVACFNLSILAIVAIIGYFVGFLNITFDALLYTILGAVELIVPAIICAIKKGRGKALKYLLLIGMLLGITVPYIFNDAVVVLLYVIPIAISCRYSNRKIVLLISGLTVFFFLGGTIGGIFTGIFYPNCVSFATDTVLNVKAGKAVSHAIVEELGYAKVISQVLLSFGLLNVLILLVISYISYETASRGKEVLMEEFKIIQNEVRINSELNLATDIQANMLPRIFPPFPDHDEFDIFASMNPAKEVGGDFYDFFMIDDSHVAIVIGDVSGKGVPAALFMVTAKTLIKDHAQLGLRPAEVFSKVNNILCEGNEAGLFVTAWMAIINIDTGVMTSVNAGHNPPAIYQDGKFTYLTSRPGFVLAGLHGLHYKEFTTQLVKGDRILLYTDGITEASNINQELYGDKRLIDYLNKNTNLPIHKLVKGITKDTKEFVGDAEQFDDMTMLLFEYISNRSSIEKTFNADIKELDNAIDFVNEQLETKEVSMGVINQISIAFEEIFVNVCHYAYKGREGKVKVEVILSETDVKILIKDTGIPFNPLLKKDPDITLSAEDRQIGGLGIYMTKKLMDKVEYVYRDEMNIITLTKGLSTK